MLRVWVGNEKAGVLDRLPYGGSTFAYDPEAPAAAAVSLTLPVRVQSYDRQRGLTPVFDMNLPEGALREKLRLEFAKQLGTFDDFDLLGVVGRSQIGRVRFTGMDEDLASDVPFQSVNEILESRRDGSFVSYLIEKYAAYSGVSGVQPKILLNGDETRSVKTATHIVKFANDDYPELPSNEFFCLEAARRLGLDVPEVSLSEDGDALVVDRFDLRDGKPLGFEDFCVLNGLDTKDKYKGGYEKSLFKRIRDYVSQDRRSESLRAAYTLFVFNAAVRNGDAHLKNWGVVYDDIDGPVELAPVYDIVTTRAYLPNDQMALTLDARPAWPEAKPLAKLGALRADLSGPEVGEIFENVADVLSDIAPELKGRFDDGAHPEVGDAMLSAWEQGVSHSLGLIRSFVPGRSMGP